MRSLVSRRSLYLLPVCILAVSVEGRETQSALWPATHGRRIVVEMFVALAGLACRSASASLWRRERGHPKCRSAARSRRSDASDPYPTHLRPHERGGPRPLSRGLLPLPRCRSAGDRRIRRFGDLYPRGTVMAVAASRSAARPPPSSLSSCDRQRHRSAWMGDCTYRGGGPALQLWPFLSFFCFGAAVLPVTIHRGREPSGRDGPPSRCCLATAADAKGVAAPGEDGRKTTAPWRNVQQTDRIAASLGIAARPCPLCGVRSHRASRPPYRPTPPRQGNPAGAAPSVTYFVPRRP